MIVVLISALILLVCFFLYKLGSFSSGEKYDNDFDPVENGTAIINLNLGNGNYTATVTNFGGIKHINVYCKNKKLKHGTIVRIAGKTNNGSYEVVAY